MSFNKEEITKFIASFGHWGYDETGQYLKVKESDLELLLELAMAYVKELK